MKTGIQLIEEERQEQIVKHGKTISYDLKENEAGELIEGALALLERNTDLFPISWDIRMCEHMFGKEYRERLIIAGALIAAELDRITEVSLSKFIRCPNG